MDFKSKAIKISPINYDKELVISQLKADRTILEQQKKRLENLFKNSTQEEIKKRLDTIVLRDNLFNAAMEEVVNHYKFEYDGEEVKRVGEQFSKVYGSRDQKVLDQIAKKIISKTLVFNDLKNDFNIEVSDDEVKNSLQKFYSTTNQSIRSYLDDKSKFENIRSVIIEEKIADALMKKFKHRFDLKPQKN